MLRHCQLHHLYCSARSRCHHRILHTTLLVISVFPLNPAGYPAGSLYIPQPVYPVTAISGLVTGATTAASVLATSQDCYSNSQCQVALYDVSTSTNVAGTPSSMPTPPNSLMFDSAGDKAYAGSQYGALLINSANLGSTTTSPFSSIPASSTPLVPLPAR